MNMIDVDILLLGNVKNRWFILNIVIVLCSVGTTISEDTGTPFGYLTDCPGFNSSITISPKTLRSMYVTVHRRNLSLSTYRKGYRFPKAAAGVIKDPNVDFDGKRTLVYFNGYLESSDLPHNLALAESYYDRNYNVIQLQSVFILMRLYPVAARLTKPVGILIGDFLTELVKAGLRPDTLELVGVSLGAHTAAFAAERLHQQTGKKPFRLTGLDPAGPCFRNADPGLSIRPSLAHRVDVLHTNIDGLGTPQPLGHVDFYANGGEFQPSSKLKFLLPCLNICSHIRAFLYWWMAVENPSGFLATRCNSVQDARRGNCYEGERVKNFLGLRTDFNRTGIFYLPTTDDFPFFAGRVGLQKQYKPTSYLNEFIPSGNLVV